MVLLFFFCTAHCGLELFIQRTLQFLFLMQGHVLSLSHTQETTFYVGSQNKCYMGQNEEAQLAIYTYGASTKQCRHHHHSFPLSLTPTTPRHHHTKNTLITVCKYLPLQSSLFYFLECCNVKESLQVLKKAGGDSPLEMCLNDCATCPTISYRTYLVDSLSLSASKFRDWCLPHIICIFPQGC